MQAESARDGLRGLASPAALVLRERRQRASVVVVDARDRVLEVHPCEGAFRRGLLPVFLARGDGDEDECRGHQEVPFPPGRVPVPGERDRDQRLGEQRERRGHGHDQEERAPPVETEVPPGGEPVQRHAHEREREQPAVRFAGRQGSVEWRHRGERDSGPCGQERDEAAAQQPLVPHDRQVALRSQVERRTEREDAGDGEPDRAGDDEAGVLPREDDPGRRERVQSEEARAAEEGERDEEHARVAAAAGGLAHDETERRTHRGDPEDQPEVGAVVLPVDV